MPTPPQSETRKSRSPRQARSRETERRLLEAAAEIIERDGLAGLSVAKVVREARSSVGSFYARFEDKDDLLRAVHRSRMASLLTRLDEMAASGACVGIEGSTLVAMCAQEMVNHYEHHPNLMAAFHARSAAAPDAWRDVVRDHVRLADTLVVLLLQGDWPARRDDIERALTLSVHMVFSFLGALSLHRDSVPDMLPFAPDSLIPEVTRMITRYANTETA